MKGLIRTASTDVRTFESRYEITGLPGSNDCDPCDEVSGDRFDECEECRCRRSRRLCEDDLDAGCYDPVIGGSLGDLDGDDDGDDDRFGDALDAEFPDELLGIDMSDAKAIGRLGEEIASRYLKARGWAVIDRNYRCRYGEADLVGYDHGEVVLVEVKTRRGGEAFPEERIDEAKMTRYRNICLHYLMKHEHLDRIRFDAIAVNIVGPGIARVRHIIDLSTWEG